MVGSSLSVVVTDEDGNTAESEGTALVTADKSSDVTLTDDYGLQSDGTGIITDRLRITFGSDFGIPRAITWYRNGAVLDTATSETGVAGRLTHTVSTADGTGDYYAVVVDDDGVSHKTNVITISSKEDDAVITAFTIEDDYTDGTDINYAATTATQVATVTMNKNFQGQFRIYKADDKKFANLIDIVATATNAPAGNPRTTDAGAAVAGVGQTTLTASAGSNYDVLQQTAGSGQGFIASDGTVTYKWSVNGTGAVAGLTRGTKYVVVFDQTSKPEDNIGRGDENVFGSEVASPYLEKPTKIAVTKAAKNAPVEVTLYTGASGDTVMSYVGLETAEAGIQAIGAKATSDIYSATKSGVETKDANKKSAVLNTAGSLKAGVWTVQGTTVTGTDAFWFASVDFNKGIYGAEEFTLRSNDQQVAYDAATAATISYDKSKPNDVKVSFGNLRTDSTVYLVALNDADGATLGTTTPTVSDELPSAAFARVYADTTQAITSASVKAGAGDYTFAGAIKGITMGDKAGSGKKAGNSYVAIVIPDNDTDYSPTYTGSAITSGGPGAWKDAKAKTVSDGAADVASTLTSYKIAGKGKFEGEVASCATGTAFAGETETAILGYDQFGTALKTTALTKDIVAAMDMTCVNPTVAKDPTKATKVTIAAKTYAGEEGYGVITIAAGDTSANEGEAWSLKLSTGQTLTVTATNTDAKGDVVWKAGLS